MKTKTNFKIFLDFTDKLNIYYYDNNFKKFEKYKNEKYVKLNDLIIELKNIIDSIPKNSCDIDSSMIGELIEELENVRSN